MNSRFVKKKACELVNEWVRESESVSYRVSEWLSYWGSEWVSEWVSLLISEWERVNEKENV